MKSKRRHELQTNELADRLGTWIEKVRPHVATFALVVVAAVTVVGVWYYWASSKEMLVNQGWRTYLLAGTNPQGDVVKELDAVAENFKDTQAGLWAAQTAADLQAGQGVRMLFEDTAKAEDYLENAITGYQEVLDSKMIKNSPMLQHRAHFGLAQTLEATGKLDDALQHYQSVVDADADSALGEVAQRNVDRLSKDATKDWYAWFAQQEPAVPEPDAITPPGGDLGAPVGNLDVVPEGPTGDFMKGLQAEESADTTDSTASDADDASADAPAKQSGDATDAEEKPAAPPKTDGPAVEPPQTEPAGPAGTPSDGAGS